MKRTSTRLAFAVVLLGASFNVLSLGLGNLREAAVLGRPLDLAIPLRVDPGDDFSAECVRAEVSFGENALRSSVVRARVVDTPAGSGRAVRVVTDVPVEEPVVTVAVSAGCPARVSRTYTVFADPPTIAVPPAVAQEPQAPAQAAPPAPARRAGAPAAAPEARAPSLPQAAAPKAAPSPAPAPRARPAQRAAKPAPARPSAPAVASAPPAAAKPPPAPQRRSSPRLQLDPLDMELAEPSLQLSQELSTPAAQTAEERQAAAAAWQALNATAEERVRDNERLLALERSLQEMRAESARTRESLDLLQAQLRRAEDARYANPLIYLLVAVCVLLAVALAWVLRQRPGRYMSWSPSIFPAESRRGELAESAGKPARQAAGAAAEAEITSPDTKLAMAAGSASHRQQAAADAAAEAAATRMTTAAAAASSRSSGFQSSRPPDEPVGANKVSVEELIDLEQQAEFFVALGQEESAIDLLRGHLQGHPDGSPLPYLKLLEIYQRRDERQPYEEIRAQFNERFNAYAPAWEDALADGRSLEDYPTVISRLQALWESPARTLEVLQASLLRRDASSQTFDLPAYRELLMLYSVARDRVEGSPEAEVDVLLPLHEEEDDFPLSMLEPLMATTPVRPYEGAMPEQGVDLELEPPAKPPPTQSAGIDFEPIRLDLPDDKRPG